MISICTEIDYKLIKLYSLFLLYLLIVLVFNLFYLGVCGQHSVPYCVYLWTLD